ncbi:uncharacterized protein LOC129725339 [Wyeomyia smithii]|uniref:uncharacterized protein LOC129725339 n=1 Tax=Wyeomyia smithii TaxID=174621 RepID=UPI002467CC44|nr:uncharacterized protein LOC129725339 [Wyeomyia smithii]
MRNEAISVLLVLLPFWSVVWAARDIFDGMTMEISATPAEDSYDDTLVNDGENGANTCINDIVPQDPIVLSPDTGPLKKFGSLLQKMPEAPQLPNFANVLQQLANAFKLSRFSEMSDVLKQIIRSYREPLQVYGKQWAGLFKKRCQEIMQNVKTVVDEQNKKIRDFFSNHFVQYKDVCLPDTNQCLQGIQTNLEQYTSKLNENLAACKRFTDRQLTQHAQWVANERKQLEKPFLKLDGCFKRGANGTNVAVCVGNLTSNTVKKLSDGMKKFSGVIGDASDSFANRMEKFRTCVVERRELLQRGQQRIADRGTQCLKNQPSKQDELFT